MFDWYAARGSYGLQNGLISFTKSVARASKAGLIGFTKSVAREVAARGVRVNAIAPGFIESDMTDAIPEKMKDAMIAQVPMKRIGQAEEVAEVAAFLASQEYLTGQTIAIDGGMTMQ